MAWAIGLVFLIPRRVAHDPAGNLPSLPAIFPEQLPPIVRNGEGGHELIMARWGMEAVAAIAQSVGFSVPTITEMPANNLSVVFYRI